MANSSNIQTPVLAARQAEKRRESTVSGLAAARRRERESHTRLERLKEQERGKVPVYCPEQRCVFLVRPDRVEAFKAKLAGQQKGW